MELFNCETCGKEISEEQIHKAIKNSRNPRYCSSECWGKRTRIYNYDHTFLDVLTPFASYFIGLFVTDGHFSLCNDIKIGLVDKQLIDDLIRITKYKNKINPSVRKNRPNAKPFYTIRFSGNVPIRIRELGYHPGVKTGSEFVPFDITDELFPHFLRGVIDGDGWWHFHNKDRQYVNCGICCSNRLFLLEIWNRLKELKIVRTGNLSEDHSKKRKMPFWRLHFGHEDSQRIGFFIYKNAEIKLDRKYKIYEAGIGRILSQRQAGLICNYGNCCKWSYSKNLCKKHYDKLYRIGYYHMHKEEIGAKNKKWKLDHKDEINARRREVYSENSDYYVEYAKNWRGNNPEKVKESKQRYLDKLKNNEPIQQRTFINITHGYSSEFLHKDTQESSYFWGFMLGGAVVKQDKRIEITSKNKEILDFLATTSSYTNKISEYKRHGELDYYGMSFGGEIAKVFVELLKNKETLNIPEHIKENVVHFIRGYFDCRGGFSHDPSGKLTSQIPAKSKPLLLSILEQLQHSGISGGSFITLKSGFRLSFSHTNATKIGEFLYRLGGFYSKIQHDRWLKYKS